jgi:RNA polymerase sigma-70 factor (ECF subfamily)
MPPDGTAKSVDLEDFREYLRILASQHVAIRFQGKVDLSGVVQETLWEAHQQMKRGVTVPIGHRLAWLRQILANNLIDAVRKLNAAKRDIARELSIHQALQESSARLEFWLATNAEQSSAIDHEELMVQVMKAMSQLPRDQEQAVMMHFCEGLQLSQIAAVLSRSRDSVAGLIKRGVHQLRRELQQLGTRR